MSRLLLLGSPEGLSITVDFNSWTTGPRFKGLKNIPSGIHYITTNLDQMFGRSGFFIDAGNALNIWQWNDACGRFNQVTDKDQLNRIMSRMHEIELGLGPYPNDIYESWVEHSKYLSWRLLMKMCPGNLTDTVTSCSRLSDVADPRMNDKSHTIHFTMIDLKHSFPQGALGELRSKYSIDKSWLLRKLISENSKEEILGEMQASFLMFILGQFYDGYEQWKILVHLICNSEQSLEDDSEFCVKFVCNSFDLILGILMHQIKECPEDFFRDVISQDNFLSDALLALASNALEARLTLELSNVLNRLWTLIYDRFRWDIQSQVKMTDLQRDNDEYAPVVLE